MLFPLDNVSGSQPVTTNIRVAGGLTQGHERVLTENSIITKLTNFYVEANDLSNQHVYELLK